MYNRMRHGGGQDSWFPNSLVPTFADLHKRAPPWCDESGHPGKRTTTTSIIIIKIKINNSRKPVKRIGRFFGKEIDEQKFCRKEVQIVSL